MNVKPPQILMVGAFPPPVHGVAVVNEAVWAHLHKAGVEPLVIDLAAPSLDRDLGARLCRLPKVMRGLVRLASMRRLYGWSLYMSVSGGLGQLYEMAFAMVGRLRGMRLFLHHHSFAYLDKPNLLTKLLGRIAGDKALHISLSPYMANCLKKVYCFKHVTAVSNAVYLVSDVGETGVKARRSLRTIGFLSNIAPEKGIFDFLDLCASLQNDKLSLRAKLAGSFQDIKTERRVRHRLNMLPNLEYLGPQYGPDKKAFFKTIDVLVFPTRYVNEAEPLVIHESMSRGIPVIAYGRGCIPEIIGSGCGKVIDPTEPFVPVALAQIKKWLSDPVAFQAESRAAVRQFSDTYAENEQRWFGLRTELLGGSVT